MESLLRRKFINGLTPEEFEKILEEYKALHELHYKRNDVSAYRRKITGKLPQLNVIILTEPWCGDSLAIVPTLLKLFEGMSEVQIRFVPRDNNPDLMDRYLTKGGRAIPKIIVMDKDFDEIFNWGPRPKVAQQIYEDHRSRVEAGEIEKKEVIKKIRNFYSKDRGIAILNDFTEALMKVLE